jgi:hypothetical protein
MLPRGNKQTSNEESNQFSRLYCLISFFPFNKLRYYPAAGSFSALAHVSFQELQSHVHGTKFQITRERFH